MKQQQQQQVGEVDQLGRLPDEVMMLIINKLYNAKTLLRLSTAAKRYSSLVSKTHSLLLVMDFTVQTTAAASSTPTPLYESCPTFDEQISVITKRFPQIKHLHLHSRSDKPPRAVIPLGSGLFSQWVAVFGSMLEQVHFLAAASANPNPNPSSGNAGNAGYGGGSLNNEPSASDVYWAGVFQGAVQNATWMHVFIKQLVSECPRIESVVFTNNCSGGGGALFMGKQHIAKLRAFLVEAELGNQEDEDEDEDDEDRPEFRVTVFREPALGLPRSAYTLTDVVFTSIISADTTGEKVMTSASDCVSTLDELDSGLGLDLDFDMDKWRVLLEAAHLIDKDKREPMYAYTLLRLPYMA